MVAGLLGRIVIVEAPSNLGLKDTGVNELSDVLLSMGLAQRLGACRNGRVDPLPYDSRRDPDTGLLNTQAIAKYSLDLADAVGKVLENGEFPLVLGGDCSILLGNLLALRRHGRFGLFFADGHADFYQPDANINGEVASSELALATGRGPDLLTKLDGYKQLVLDEDVVAFGFRDLAEQLEYGSQPLSTRMLALDLTSVRRLGIVNAARQAIKGLCREEVQGVWIHLDADVLSDDIMPAVDYRQPGGFSWNELVDVLGVICESRLIVGLDVTIYNPRYDTERLIARNFVDAIVEALT